MNLSRIDGDVAYILCPFEGGHIEVKVDAEDLAWILDKFPRLKVKRFKSGHGGRTTNIYACHYKYNNGVYLLHREILKAPRGKCVTFIDGNSLNCTKDNMRVGGKTDDK